MAYHPKTFVEFFAGIGLVHEGLLTGGWSCLYANDIDPKKKVMYAAQFASSNYYHVEDIWKTDAVLDHIQVPPVLATASFPCTDLSLAGHGRGIDGKHSSSYFGFIEVLKGLGDNRPKLIMIENVCGFFTSRGGDDFSRAVKELASLGYWIDAIVVDAKHFVPQSRPRTFVFAIHESVQSKKITRQSSNQGFADPWRIEIASRPDLRPAPLRRLMENLELQTGWLSIDLPHLPQLDYCLENEIDVDENQDWWTVDVVNKHCEMMELPSRRRVEDAVASGDTVVGTAFRRTRRGKTRLEVRFDIAGCLRTPKGGSAKQIIVTVNQGTIRMRWMSAREYARLQGAPHFAITVPTTQAMFGFGDAVCVPVIEWIDAHVLTPLYECVYVQSQSASYAKTG